MRATDERRARKRRRVHPDANQPGVGGGPAAAPPAAPRGKFSLKGGYSLGLRRQLGYAGAASVLDIVDIKAAPTAVNAWEAS